MKKASIICIGAISILLSACSAEDVRTRSARICQYVPALEAVKEIAALIEPRIATVWTIFKVSEVTKIVCASANEAREKTAALRTTKAFAPPVPAIARVPGPNGKIVNVPLGGKDLLAK